MTQADRCDCELRNRQWDPLSGRCLFCRRYYVDEHKAREERAAAVKLAELGARKADDETATDALEDLNAIMRANAELMEAAVSAPPAPPKTWSVVADKMGGHWHTTIRRGIEGSRGRLGELTFDLSDAEDVRDGILEVAGQLATHTIVCTIEWLRRHDLTRQYPNVPGQFSALLGTIGDDIRKEVLPPVLEHLIRRFGVRLDLAKIGANEPVYPMRDIVSAQEVKGQPDRWLVTLICGHKKFTDRKEAQYQCRECPKEHG